MTKINQRIMALSDSPLNAVLAAASDLEGVVSLGVGEPDFDTPWAIRAEAIYHIEKGNTFYTSDAGLFKLRDEISNYLKRRFALSYDPHNEIIVTVGGSEAIDIVLRTFINEGDEVIVLEPGYISYRPCIALAGGIVKAIQLKEEDGFRLLKEDLEQAITDKTKLLMLNFPSNPTGGVMSYEDYQALVPLIKKHDLIVVSDEIYAEFSYGESYHPFACLEEVKDQVITISGFSKQYSMTGWRIGYVCASAQYIKHISKVHQYVVLSAPTVSQYAAIVALKECDDDILMMKKSYQERRNYIVKGLNDMGLDCKIPQGAFYVFPSIKQYGLSSVEFCTQLLIKEKVALVPGNAFGEAGEGFVRCSYAYSIDEIKEALLRIKRFLASLQEDSVPQ